MFDGTLQTKPCKSLSLKTDIIRRAKREIPSTSPNQSHRAHKQPDNHYNITKPPAILLDIPYINKGKMSNPKP